MTRPMSLGVEAFDAMLGGGLPTASLVQIFGLKALGKSIMCLQAAVKNASEGRSTLIVDTELGYANNVAPHWLGPLNERFKVKAKLEVTKVERAFEDTKRRKPSEAFIREALVNALRQVQVAPTDQQLTEAVCMFMPYIKLTASSGDKASIYLTEAPGLVDLLALHGARVEILVSEGGRVEVRLQPHGLLDPRYSPVGRFVKEKEVSLVIYDSVSAPMKAVFAGTQDLPARSSSLALLLGQVQRLCGEMELAVLAINHISVHPHNPAWTHPYGGLIVGYDFKYVFHLEKAPSESKLQEFPITNPDRIGKANRLLWSYRHPREEEYGSAALLNLDEWGFS